MEIISRSNVYSFNCS